MRIRFRKDTKENEKLFLELPAHALRQFFGGTLDSETWRGIGSYMLWQTLKAARTNPAVELKKE
ncbi:MAG: hypothetical protein K6A62_05070 [Bacteroidales bacterium]|nr:hypothetical protein [Bacteroidales bacterium]